MTKGSHSKGTRCDQSTLMGKITKINHRHDRPEERSDYSETGPEGKGVFPQETSNVISHGSLKGMLIFPPCFRACVRPSLCKSRREPAAAANRRREKISQRAIVLSKKKKKMGRSQESGQNATYAGKRSEIWPRVRKRREKLLLMMMGTFEESFALQNLSDALSNTVHNRLFAPFYYTTYRPFFQVPALLTH